MNESLLLTCRRCGNTSNQKYCGQCGEAMAVKRITLSSLLHDVFHFFTHLDKGFGFTVKQLLLRPGNMQRDYLDGDRSRYQKPFSMFFICATIDALVRYWVISILIRYFHSGNANETEFFHQYFVLTHIVMLPVYVLVTWLVFYNAKFNYAETGILILYNISFFFLAVMVLFLPKLIWPDLETMWLELIVISVYNAVAFINFYRDQNKWLVIVKSLFVVVTIFLLANYVEDLLTALLHKS